LGRDYFFRFDTLAVLTEVHAGPESLSLAKGANPVWRRDQEVLASLFMHRGNIRGAAESYAKLWSAYPGRPDYALYAATAFDALSDTLAAMPYYRAASSALGDSTVRRMASSLVPAARGYRDSALIRRNQSRASPLRR
jgi:hypothetical protein